MDKLNKCGLLCWYPEWIQKYAKSQYFAFIYGLLGTVQTMAYMYLMVTLTTLEKRFKIPSQTTGILLSGNSISQILLSLILSYAGGQRNRPRWMAFGMVFWTIACLVLWLLHIIYGPGEEALQLTQEYAINVNSSTSSKDSQNLCDGNEKNNENCEEIVSHVPLFLIFLSQLLIGIGNALSYSLGQAYLDDNTKKTNTPLTLAFVMSLRMIGPIFGFLLGAAVLSIYIDPKLTPIIDQKSPKWMGAWWIGWMILAVIMLLIAGLIVLFPKKLPKKKEIKSNIMENNYQSFDSSFPSNSTIEKPVVEKKLPKLKDFPKALMRLIKNKLLIFNIASVVCYNLGLSGFMTFLTKYMEVQFHKNAQNATILTGPLSLSGMVLGFLTSGFIITKMKPTTSKLLFWNVIIGILHIIGQSSYLFLYCSNESSSFINEGGSLKNLTNVCNVDCGCNGVSYDPVCHTESNTTLYSACHAGCQSWNIDDKIFMNCSCITKDSETFYLHGLETNNLMSNFIEFNKPSPSILSKINLDSVKPGNCADGCLTEYYIFVAISMLIQFLGSSGRISNILVEYRAVSTEDKTFAQGLVITFISLLALVPAPIIYGGIIDSSCIVWSDKCGVSGNCQLYDQNFFRNYINATAILITLIGLIFDLLVWWYGRNLDMYGENAE